MHCQKIKQKLILLLLLLLSAENLEFGIRFKALPEEECAKLEVGNYYCYCCL
jgi:hypothetical protein